MDYIIEMIESKIGCIAKTVTTDSFGYMQESDYQKIESELISFADSIAIA
ncbi:hypothetical protein SAMN04487770_11535 [Butyrivibrio sp. ob235]|nr:MULTISPECIES: hypothetical protein [unclassified Butyrivibrio]SEL69261.1 hypothetical protein SAMN04487770_11535 [Butyrivibrio sp. ob235]